MESPLISPQLKNLNQQWTLLIWVHLINIRKTLNDIYSITNRLLLLLFNKKGDCKVTFKNVPEDINILPVINNLS
jgi:hypothetical protein